MRYSLILFSIFILFITACSASIDMSDDPRMPSNSPDQKRIEKIDWKSFELKDISSGKYFKINDFKDKPVLLESFAVWCPSSIRQQRATKELHDELGENFISISLDTDPNENEEKVKRHIERNGYTWWFANSPADLTRSLISQFGVDIVNAPQAPMILICNGQARMLEKGVKSSEDLKKELDKCM